MRLEEFQASLERAQPPPELSAALRALWLEARGDWEAAHAAVADESGADCALVHAYLHRREGDESNARYWYRRAGREEARDALEEEWSALVAELLGA